MQSLATGERKILIKGGADARYVPTGHLVYMRVGTLMAVPFNLETLEVTGSPVAVAADVMQATNPMIFPLDSGAGQFSVSTSGTLVYVPGGLLPAPERSVLWVDRTGAERPWPARQAPIRPCGSRLTASGSPSAHCFRVTATCGLSTSFAAV